MKPDPIQPRLLRFRSHYKVYFWFVLLLFFLLGTFWSLKLYKDGWSVTVEDNKFDLVLSVVFLFVSSSAYFFWLRTKIKKSVQVFADHLLIHHGREKESILFSEIESVSVVCWSIFYVKMKSGVKHYFNSSFERVDYVWEGLHEARPELFSDKFEEYRVKLVQYDHHQKRKEWFFKHKMVDIITWLIVPMLFLALGYLFQSREVIIHHKGLYFFRLLMYALLVLVSTTLFYSLALKKFLFDKIVSAQSGSTELKVRDLEFEGMILQRSKIFQLVTATFVLAMVIRLDVNLYSVSKIKQDMANFKLEKGNTIVIDNRYNCLGCKYPVADGDFIVFGRGVVGQILAKEGDMVGQVSQDKTGRMIASENIHEVPRGHVAVKAANGKDIVFVKIEELIGKIQK